MPRPHTTMRKIRDVLRLRFAEKLSLRHTALSLAMPLTTVADYVSRARAAGLTWPLGDLDDDALERRLFRATPAAPSSYPQPDFAAVKRELANKGVTLQLLWLEYRELHPDGYGYSQFCQPLSHLASSRLASSCAKTTRPAEKLFVDYPGMTIPIYDAADLGGSFRAELFVAVLGASSYTLRRGDCALSNSPLGGGPRARPSSSSAACPRSSCRTICARAVTKAHRYEPDLNATYQEMARHYGTALIPARPYRPRDKAKAEVRRAARRALDHRRVFASSASRALAQLNEVIGELVDAPQREAL